MSLWKWFFGGNTDTDEYVISNDPNSLPAGSKPARLTSLDGASVAEVEKAANKLARTVPKGSKVDIVVKNGHGK